MNEMKRAMAGEEEAHQNESTAVQTCSPAAPVMHEGAAAWRRPSCTRAQLPGGARHARGPSCLAAPVMHEGPAGHSTAHILDSMELYLMPSLMSTVLRREMVRLCG